MNPRRRVREALVAVALLQTSIASAQHACDGLATMERVAADDRVFLDRLCRADAAYVERLRDDQAAEHAQLKQIVTQLVAWQGWEAALVAQLMPAEMFEGPTGSEGTFDPRCDVRTALRDSVLATQRSMAQQDPTQRFAMPLVLPDHCGSTQRQDRATSSLAVIAPAEFEVRVLAAGERPRRLAVSQWRGEPVIVAARGLFHTRLPFNRPYVAIARARPETGAAPGLPTVFTGVALGDRTHHADEAQAMCVGFQIKVEPAVPVQATQDVPVVAQVEPAVSVLLDGTPIDLAQNGGRISGTIWVPVTSTSSATHALSVLRSDGGEPIMLADRPLNLEPARSHGCEEVRLDLTHKSDKSGKKGIGVLQIDAERCVEAGVDSAKLHDYIASFLLASKFKMIDLRAWSYTTRFFSDFRQTLDTLGGKPVGAERGQFDVVANAGTASAELTRQGFDSLMWLELRCTRNEENRWDYSFLAKRLDLSALAQRGRDPLAGVDLDGLLKTEIELARSRDALGPAIELGLARLLDLPAATFLPQPSELHFASAISTEVEVHVPKPPRDEQPKPLTVRLAGRGVPSEQDCARLGDQRALRRERDRALEATQGWTELGRYQLRPGVADQRWPMAFSPKAPVPTLLKLSLSDPDDHLLATSFRCVDLGRSSMRVWTSFVVAWSTEHEDARVEDVRTIVGLVGVERSILTWFGWSLGLGVAQTERRGLTPSDWESVNSVVVTDGATGFERGRLPYEMSSWGMLLHVGVVASASLCEFGNLFSSCSVPALRGLLLSARLLLIGGIYRTNQDSSDSRLMAPEAHDRAHADLALLLQPGLVYHASRLVAFDARVAVGVPRLINQFCGPGTGGDCYVPLMLGGSLGVSWEL
jgi:hypothetical protein